MKNSDSNYNVIIITIISIIIVINFIIVINIIIIIMLIFFCLLSLLFNDYIFEIYLSFYFF